VFLHAQNTHTAFATITPVTPAFGIVEGLGWEDLITMSVVGMECVVFGLLLWGMCMSARSSDDIDSEVRHRDLWVVKGDENESNAKNGSDEATNQAKEKGNTVEEESKDDTEDKLP